MLSPYTWSNRIKWLISKHAALMTVDRPDWCYPTTTTGCYARTRLAKKIACEHCYSVMIMFRVNMFDTLLSVRIS